MSNIKVDTTTLLPPALPQKSTTNENKEENKKPPRRRHNRDRKHTKSLNVDVAFNDSNSNSNRKPQANNLEQSKKQHQSVSSNKNDNLTSIKINITRQNSNETKKHTGSGDLSSSLNDSSMKVANEHLNNKKASSTNNIMINEINRHQNTTSDAINTNKNSAAPRLSSTNKAVTVSVLQNNLYENNFNNMFPTNLIKTRNVYSSNEQSNNHFHQHQQQQQQQQPQWQNSELSVEFLRDLEKNFIVKLKNPSKNNSLAKYRCTICNYFCNTLDRTQKHINGSIHKNNLETIRLEMKIRDLDMPSQSKLDALSQFLVEFYLKNIITTSRLKKIYEIYYKFKQKFLSKYPDANINMYGSIAYGICFNDSSCDISIEFESTTSAKNKTNIQIIEHVSDLIKNEMSDTFHIKTNQNSNKQKNSKQTTNQCLNKITVESFDSKIVFNFTSGIHPVAHKTSTLLRCYFELDERARILAFCFRYIAKLAQIDKIDLCTLPPHSYAIMSIYFLQQLSPPVLPILHEIIDSKKLISNKKQIEDSSKSTVTTKRTDSISETTKSSLTKSKQRNKSKHLKETLDEPEYDHDTIDNFNVFKKNLNDYLNGKTWRSSNSNSVGALWLKLLTFYSIDFGFKKTFISVRKQKRISKSKVKMYTKKMAIEDPFSLKQSLSRNLLTQTNKYIINIISKSCLYFVLHTHCIIENIKIEGNLKEEKCNIVEKLIAETGILDAKKSNGLLEEDHDDQEDEDDDVTNIENGDESFLQTGDSDEDEETDDLFYFNKTKPIKTKRTKKVSTKNLGTLESINNLTKEIDSLLKLKSLSNEDDTKNSLSIELESLASNIQHQGLESEDLDMEDEEAELGLVDESENNEDEGEVEEETESCDNESSTDIESESAEDSFFTNQKFKTKSEHENGCIKNMSSLDEYEAASRSCINYVLKRVVEMNENFNEIMPNIELSTKFESKEMNREQALKNFKFTANTLGFSKSPPLTCSICNKDGHLQSDCPQDRLPTLEDLPSMTEKWREVLDNICRCIMDDNVQSRKEENDRNVVFKQIKQIVSQRFSEAKLSLFGSSNNGFAMKNSDLDICMTLENCSDKDKTSLNFKKIIRTLGSLFRREQGEFDMIEERVSAKVPIVKFRHRRTMIEGDISLYNTLALKNTDLLRAYAEIDERTKILGHTVKYFAKICRIGDASCGSLSSYAYIVMMIHYLMNTSPPVLPCLQNLNKENLTQSETNVTVDGWDCWFNRDIKNLDKLWPKSYKQNKQSVGELWLGFLRYYTETFDWDNHVVCIRDNNGYLTRKIKNWTKNMLAIEDPFELTHNLAAGVSPKMALYILKSFSKARLIFGQVIDDFRPNETRFNMEYFFNPKSLVEGNPPMDRNCFSCFKIGHQTKDCPLANKRRDKQANGDSYKDEGCFRCKNYGHMARDCPMTNEQINNINANNKRNKTNTVIKNDSSAKCFKCNQTGHFARDCPENNKSQNNIYQNTQMIQQQKPTLNINHNHFLQIQQQQQQLHFQQIQEMKINQQSAPAPKIITFMNPPINPPIVLKTGDNVQFLVNPNLSTNFPSSSSTSSSASSPSSANNDAVAGSAKNSNTNSTNQTKQKRQVILQKPQPSPAKISNNIIDSDQYLNYRVNEMKSSSNKNERTRLTSLNTDNSNSSYSNSFSLYQQYNNLHNSYSNSAFNIQQHHYAPSSTTTTGSQQYLQNKNQTQPAAQYVTNRMQNTNVNMQSGELLNGDGHNSFFANTNTASKYK